MRRSKKILATLAATALLMTILSTVNAQETIKIGVFDPQRVSEETIEGKRIQARLEALRDKRQTEITTEERAIGEAQQQLTQQALSLSPVTLPLTDVLTGLQTGLIDIVAIPPYVALILQWHTKVKYVTRLPLVYTFGFMAVDKRSFEKISPGDQAVVREVMGRVYENFNKVNLVDNDAAFDALLNSGIESVELDEEEFIKTRKVLLESNLQLGEQGKFSKDLYDEMMRYIDEYRGQHGAIGRN